MTAQLLLSASQRLCTAAQRSLEGASLFNRCGGCYLPDAGSTSRTLEEAVQTKIKTLIERSKNGKQPGSGCCARAITRKIHELSLRPLREKKVKDNAVISTGHLILARKRKCLAACYDHFTRRAKYLCDNAVVSLKSPKEIYYAQRLIQMLKSNEPDDFTLKFPVR